MSNALAIATVTTALAQIVRAAARSAVSGADVVTGRPEAAGNGNAPRRVHVYLYQISPNVALRNLDLPARNGEGRVVQRPQVALDLNYLFTFYGSENQLEPQRMLGAVVRDLHARPILTRQMIRDAVSSQNFLQGSDLADGIETVRFTPASLTLEELSKLWSVFLQTPHALSVAYQGTLVLIESEEKAQAALPVLRRGEDDRGVDNVIGPFPILERIHIGDPLDANTRPRPPSYPSAQLGARITLIGYNLGGDAVRVRFTHPRLAATPEITVPEADRTQTEIGLTLPDDAAAQTDWAAGLYVGRTIVKRGDKEHATNDLPLPLAPRITAVQPSNTIARNPQGSASITIVCAPNVLPDQPAFLLFADREVKAEPHAAATSELVFVVRDAPVVNKAVVRLRVDGVDSLPFERKGDPPRLEFAESQKVTIT